MSKRKRIILFLVITFLVMIAVFYDFRSSFSYIYQVMTKGTLEDMIHMIRSWGIWAPVISVVLMILQAFIAPIPAFLVTGANGVIFGVWWGALISWVGAMLGATGTFYLARIMGADFIKKIEKDSQLLSKVDELSQKHGFKVILVGRLLPFVSFDFMSYAAGLSSIKAREFFIATAVGMIPGTFAYVFLGNKMMALSAYSNWLTAVVLVVIVALIVINYVKDKRKGKH